MVLDLKTDAGMAAFRGLLADTDVFVTNVRRQSLESLGIEYEQIHADFPKLIYAHVTGWGRSDTSNTGTVEAADEYADNLKSLIWKLRKDTGFAAPVVAFCPRLARETPAYRQSPRTGHAVCAAMREASEAVGGVTALMDAGERVYADAAGLEVSRPSWARVRVRVRARASARARFRVSVS